MNKFDVTSRFGVVSKFDGIHSHLGAVNDLLAGHNHAADLVHQATVAAEMMTGHNHAADLVHQATVAAEMMTGHKYAAGLASEFRAATEILQVHKELTAAMTPWREMMDLGKTYGIGDTVLTQFSRMSELDHGLARFFPGNISQHWSAHLKLAAAPALTFLAHEWPERRTTR